ncbi:MAG TPA: DUF2628 domain-containing protein [Allosphingosinicella sp.]|jgi:hypothetical protein
MTERPGLFDFAAQKARSQGLWQRTSWDEIAAFIGPNADRFHSAWEATRAKFAGGRGGIAFGFCLPALLLGFAWFLYRRMWMFGAMLLVLPIALSYLLDSPGGSIGLSIAMSLFGKSLYVQHAVAKIGALRDRGAGDDEIAAAGGTSLAGGLAGGLILAAGLGSLVYLVATGSAP